MDSKACTKCGEVKALNAFALKKGRPDGRDSQCKQCKNAAAKAYYLKPGIAERTADRTRQYRATQIGAAKFKAYRSTPEFLARKKELHREYVYGMDNAAYEALMALQNGGCAVCRLPLAALRSKHIHIDHSHKDGRVRGLLCKFCNLAEGFLGKNGDSFEIAQRLACYLDWSPADELRELV